MPRWTALVALLALLGGASPSRADATAAPPPAVKPPAAPVVKPPAAARAKSPATRQPLHATHVWTAADLERLHQERSPISYAEVPTPLAVDMTAPALPGRPQGVPQRYQEIISEADAQLAALKRQELAATNPLLRGLAGADGPRPLAEIQSDMAKWNERKTQAEAGLSTTGGD